MTMNVTITILLNTEILFNTYYCCYHNKLANLELEHLGNEEPDN